MMNLSSKNDVLNVCLFSICLESLLKLYTVDRGITSIGMPAGKSLIAMGTAEVPADDHSPLALQLLNTDACVF